MCAHGLEHQHVVESQGWLVRLYSTGQCMESNHEPQNTQVEVREAATCNQNDLWVLLPSKTKMKQALIGEQVLTEDNLRSAVRH